MRNYVPEKHQQYAIPKHHGMKEKIKKLEKFLKSSKSEFVVIYGRRSVGKSFLAAILLVCLAPMPYGYYTFVRFVSMVSFGVMAYRYYAQHKTALTITFASLAVLFQPFIKIALGRTMWNIVDVIVAILLVRLWIKERK